MFFLFAILTTSPKVDLTFPIVTIISLSTIGSSVLVAVVNNIFQMKLKTKDLNYQKSYNDLQLETKKAEYEQQKCTKSLEYKNLISIKELENNYSLKKYQWETYYKSATEIFTSMLTNVGKYLADPSDLTQYENSVASIYQSFAFADEELSYLLFELIDVLHCLAHDTSGKYKSSGVVHSMEDCAKYINKILTKYLQS